MRRRFRKLRNAMLLLPRNSRTRISKRSTSTLRMFRLQKFNMPKCRSHQLLKAPSRHLQVVGTSKIKSARLAKTAPTKKKNVNIG